MAETRPADDLILIFQNDDNGETVSGKRRLAGPKIIRAVMRRIEGGTLDPGERIMPREIANSLGTSDIPVREAFYQLVGQGLLVERPGEGFYAATVSSTALRTYYMAHGSIIDALLNLWQGEGAISFRHATAWKMFEALAGRSSDDALAAMQHHVSNRLAPARSHEAALAGYDGLTENLKLALTQGNLTAARKASRDFHRARAKQAAAIWKSMTDK
jgi:DNA-binding GntR family transcriptional regulator